MKPKYSHSECSSGWLSMSLANVLAYEDKFRDWDGKMMDAFKKLQVQQDGTAKNVVDLQTSQSTTGALLGICMANMYQLSKSLQVYVENAEKKGQALDIKIESLKPDAEQKGKLMNLRIKYMERKLQLLNSKRQIQVETSNVGIFIVYDVAKQFIVDMERRSCTCSRFQYHEMPCTHAAVVIRKRNLSCYDYCSWLYAKTTLVKTYSRSIMSLDDKANWDVPPEIKNICVLPPHTRRPVGRPKLGRYKNVSEIKCQIKCSRCEEKRHNRKTCKNPVANRSKTVNK